jgi:hypothetical protein
MKKAGQLLKLYKTFDQIYFDSLDYQDYYTIEESVKILGASYNNITRSIREKKIPTVPRRDKNLKAIPREYLEAHPGLLRKIRSGELSSEDRRGLLLPVELFGLAEVIEANLLKPTKHVDVWADIEFLNKKINILEKDINIIKISISELQDGLRVLVQTVIELRRIVLSPKPCGSGDSVNSDNGQVGLENSINSKIESENFESFEDSENFESEESLTKSEKKTRKPRNKGVKNEK